jgi:hypothetical protein
VTKCHLSKDCPKTRSFFHNVVKANISHLGPKNDTSTVKVISSPYNSPRGIWVPKHLLTNYEGPNKKMKSLLYYQVYEPLCKFDLMQSQGQDKCLSIYLNSTLVSLPCSLAN